MKKNLLSLAIIISSLMIGCKEIIKTNKIDLIPVKIGQDFGYVDLDGKIIINPQFSQAYVFNDNRALVRSKGENQKYGFIDNEGKYIATGFLNATCFNEDIAWIVMENGEPIAINQNGEHLFPLPNSYSVSNFSEGMAAYSTYENNSILWGFIDKTGKTVITPQFKNVGIFKDGLCPIMDDSGMWGYIEKTGKIIINPQFTYAHWFENGKAKVQNESTWGVIDKTGKFIINPQFDDIQQDGSFYMVKLGSLFGWAESDGKISINPQFDASSKFNGAKLAAVKFGDKWGYINIDGKYEINAQFDYALPFNGNIAIVYSGNKFGIIDKEGKYIANPQFDDISADYLSRVADGTTVKWTVYTDKKPGATETAEKYLNALMKKDYAKAKEIGTKNTQDMLDALVSMNMAPVISKVENLKCDEYENEAVCTYCCASEGKSSIKLIKEAGVWLVDEKKEGNSSESEQEQTPIKIEEQNDYWRH